MNHDSPAPSHLWMYKNKYTHHTHQFIVLFVKPILLAAPENPEGFKQIEQNETSITLQWKRVQNIQEYIFLFNNKETNISSKDGIIKHRISNLESGTKYEFYVFTLFEMVRSSGTNTFEATGEMSNF